MSKANFFDVLYDIEYNIGIYGCRSMTFPMSHAICKPAFPPPAAGRTSHVPAGNLNMTRNLKFSSCPGIHHPLLFCRLHNISQVFSQLAKSNLLVMQVWWSGLSSRAAGLGLTVSGPYGHILAELEI